MTYEVGLHRINLARSLRRVSNARVYVALGGFFENVRIVQRHGVE